MFLDNVLGIFANSKSVNGYYSILFDEFVKTKKADYALDKATEFARLNNMSNAEIKKGKSKVAQQLESYLRTAEYNSEQDLEEIVNLIKNLQLEENKEKQFLKIGLDRCLISMALKGIPYEFDKSVMPLSIIYKNGEKLHYLHSAINVKKRRKTVTVKYHGPVASVQICKGLRYRIGSMKVSPEVVESYDTSDQGIFYITNMRVGFLGTTQFSFDLKKMVSIQNGEAGLLIYKQGRENPFMIAFDDYDVPCSILSCLLNQ